MKKIFWFAVALFFMGWSQAFADYTFTYTSNDSSVRAYGILDTSTNGPGPLTVTGGFITITGTGLAAAGLTPVAGVPLFPNPGGSNVSTSPAGAYYYDNQLSPTGSSSHILDYWGLLFKNGSTEINLYNLFGAGSGSSNSAAATSYQLLEFPSTGYNNWNTFTLTNTGTFAVSAVSVPPSLLLLAPCLLGLVGLRKRLKA
jgi:hypothetical protein